ncbi:MAG TPA: riboflavin synthase [Candidatus Acidoferrum sp.]|nr:riboflavin synthase [Candidatus Acidoferrum sp.]
MFTGIIEHVGTIEALELRSAGGHLTIRAPGLAESLCVSNSIAVNGCCLTVVSQDQDRFSADLSGETLQKTSFGSMSGGLRRGAPVNLERPLTAGKELGGHFVQGHVDSTGRITRLEPEQAGSSNWWLGVEVPGDFERYVVPKGSIAMDGISLTVARWNSRLRIVEVAVIPYTYEHTNLRNRKPGDAVNLESDVLGKYVERYLEARNDGRAASGSAITISRLREEGF